MDRPRRRLGCWLAMAVIAVLLFACWLLLPRIVCLVANTSLPRELGPHATLLALDPAAHDLPAAPIILTVDPELMRRIGADASGRWIPPGVVRDGLGAIGTVRGEGNLAVPWQAIASTGVTPPRLAIALTPEQANALLAAEPSASPLAGMTVSPQLSSLELAALPDDGANRRFRVEAAGALHLAGGTLSLRVPVRRLVAEVTVEFTPAASGWEPGVRLLVTTLEAPLPALPGIDAAGWRKLLGAWAEQRIADQLSGRTIPAWFPIDLSVSAVVR